jgi:hypothetical protein
MNERWKTETEMDGLFICLFVFLIANYYFVVLGLELRKPLSPTSYESQCWVLKNLHSIEN